MPIGLPEWSALALFAGLTLAIAMFVLAAAGHFPLEPRAQALRSNVGHAMLWTAIAVVTLATAAATYVAISRLPLPAAIIAGGLAILVAPLALQRMADEFVDGSRGLIVLSGLAAGLALITILV
ncbi:MAG: hypothetical protein R3D67_13010 [Hyphomicrobiaceae bacterium]